jgi:hypothetical protein
MVCILGTYAKRIDTLLWLKFFLLYKLVILVSYNLKIPIASRFYVGGLKV